MGEGGSVGDKPIPEVIDGLRALLRAIDAGRIDASVAQRAYLEGAVDTLKVVSERSHCDKAAGDDCPDVHPAH